MKHLDLDLAEVRKTIADTEQAICRLERQVDAAQSEGLPSYELEATQRAARSLLGALFACRESLLDRIAREEMEHGTG